MDYSVNRIEIRPVGKNISKNTDYKLRFFKSGKIPPTINQQLTIRITHKDFLPDPFPNQRKEIIIKLIDNVSGEELVRKFSEPPEFGSNRTIVIKLP